MTGGEDGNAGGWAVLPMELLELLVGALPLSQLAACRLACQHWSKHLSPRRVSVVGPAPSTAWEAKFAGVTELRWRGVRPEELRAAARLRGLATLSALLATEEGEEVDRVVPAMVADGGLRRLTSLGLAGGSCYMSDAGLAQLAAALPGLASLQLEPGPLVTSGAALAALTALTALDLQGMGFYPHRLLASLAPGALPQLTSLELGRDRPCRPLREDGTLQHLAATAPRLASLKLTVGRGVTEAGLAALGALSGLRTLDLSGSPVADLYAADALEGLTALHSLTGLRMSRCDLCDECLAALAPLTTLTALDLSYPKYFEGLFLDCWLEELADLTGLRTLRLSGCRDIDVEEGMTHLAALTALTELDIGRTGVMHGAGDLRWLLHHSGLTALHLGESPFVNDGHLALLAESLTSLTHLDLSRPSTYPALSAFWTGSRANDEGDLDHEHHRLTDAGLAEALRLPRLSRLRLDNCLHITDAAVAGLAGAPSLAWLSLRGCGQLTDHALAPLGRCAGLTHLDVSGCEEMSPEALEQVEAMLPGLTLVRCLGEAANP